MKLLLLVLEEEEIMTKGVEGELSNKPQNRIWICGWLREVNEWKTESSCTVGRFPVRSQAKRTCEKRELSIWLRPKGVPSTFIFHLALNGI